MTDIPSFYVALLLALAAYRTWRLLAEDDILDRPRRRVLRLGREWQKEGDPVPEGFRAPWALFLTCPACAGFWIAIVWWVAWLAIEDWATTLAVPFALSAVIIFMRGKLDPPE